MLIDVPIQMPLTCCMCLVCNEFNYVQQSLFWVVYTHAIWLCVFFYRDLAQEAWTKVFPWLPQLAECQWDTHQVLLIYIVFRQTHTKLFFPSTLAHACFLPLNCVFAIAGIEAGWYVGCAVPCLWVGARFTRVLLVTDWRESARATGTWGERETGGED